MKGKKVVLCALAALLCLAGTAAAQDRVFHEAGCAFQSCGGLVGGAELLVLKAFSTYDGAIADASGLGDSRNELKLAPRLWVGYVGPSGLGLRGRWFQYQHALNAGSGVADVNVDLDLEVDNFLDVYAVDVEFMQSAQLGCWLVNAGAGLRAGGVKRRTTADLVAVTAEQVLRTDRLSTRFEGVGPTIFAELVRPIGASGFSLVANTRGSLLFGESTTRHAAVFNGEPNEEFNGLVNNELGDVFRTDAVVAVGEIQIGVEYASPIGNGGAIGFIQCLWEGQIWTNASNLPSLGPGQYHDLGLMGIALNVGITR